MQKKLIHTFAEQHAVTGYISINDGPREEYRTSYHEITVNGVFDDGTWEPLFKYRHDFIRAKLNRRNIKGLYNATRSDVVETVKKLCDENKIRYMVALIH